MRSGTILEEIRSNWPEVLTHQTAAALLAHRLIKHPAATREAVLQRHELSGTEFHLLFALRCAPSPHEVQPTILCDRLLLSSGGLSKLVKRLADRGLLERPAGSGDRRVRPVKLTDTGRTLVEETLAEMSVKVAAHGVSDSDFAKVEDALLELMQKLEDAADAREVGT